MLFLKLILTPLLLGGVTLAGRKFGQTGSGWLVGLPLTSGPVSFFLALEQGNVFAAHAAQGSLMGVISLSAFCVVYCWLSLRFGWPLCWLGRWGAYLAATFLFTRLIFPLPLALILAVCVLCASLYMLPGERKQINKVAPVTISATWDIALRMLIATLFV